MRHAQHLPLHRSDAMQITDKNQLGQLDRSMRVAVILTLRPAMLPPNLRAIVDDLRSQGFTSVRTIAAQLNERGILTPRGAAWHPTSAARLLSRLQA
jgi:hypothetical protein